MLCEAHGYRIGVRRASFLAVAVLCLSGCGSDNEPTSSAAEEATPSTSTPATGPTDPAPTATSTPTTPSAPSGSPEGDAERQIERVFADYNASLVKGDFAAGCRYLAPETIAKLRENLEKVVADPPEGCEAGLRALYQRIDDKYPEQKRQLTEIATTARIEKLTVTGNSAIVNWSAKYEGKRVKLSQSARQVGGQWKLVDVSN